VAVLLRYWAGAKGVQESWCAGAGGRVVGVLRSAKCVGMAFQPSRQQAHLPDAEGCFGSTHDSGNLIRCRRWHQLRRRNLCCWLCASAAMWSARSPAQSGSRMRCVSVRGGSEAAWLAVRRLHRAVGWCYSEPSPGSGVCTADPWSSTSQLGYCWGTVPANRGLAISDSTDVCRGSNFCASLVSCYLSFPMLRICCTDGLCFGRHSGPKRCNWSATSGLACHEAQSARRVTQQLLKLIQVSSVLAVRMTGTVGTVKQRHAKRRCGSARANDASLSPNPSLRTCTSAQYCSPFS
jgi:hypothetical protein